MYWINLIGTTIVSMLASYICICNITKTNLKVILEPKKILIYILLNIAFLINLMFMTGLNKVLLNAFILIFLNLSIIFNFEYKKSVYYALIFLITISIIEIVIAGLSTLLFDFSQEKYKNLELGMLFFSIFNSFVIVLVSKIRIYSNSCLKISELISDKLKSFLFLFFITFYILLLCMNNLFLLGKSINYYINFGLFVFVLLSSIFIVYNSIQKNKIEDKYNQMMEYVSKYEKIINEQGKRNHEFNNQLMVLNGYVNDKKKLKEYLSLLISEQKGGQNYRIKQLGLLPDGGLKGLIYYKLSKMEEKGIKSFFFVSDNLSGSFDNFSAEFYRDFTKIFGVFIDNAIDAASEANPKEVEIDIKKDDNYLIVNISNTFKKNIDTNKIGNKGYSSKGVGHGFGLSIVKEISKNSDKIDTFSDIEKDMFKQTIMIDLK